MTKEEWKSLLTEEEVIFTGQSTKKNKEILNKIGEEKVIDKIAEICSTKGLRLHYNDNPIGDFMITEGEFEGEHNRLYLKATSMEIAQRRAEALKNAGYKADSAYELYVPWTRVFNII